MLQTLIFKLLRGSRPTLFLKAGKITLRNINLIKPSISSISMDEVARIIPNNHNIWTQIRIIIHMWLHHFIEGCCNFAVLDIFYIKNVPPDASSSSFMTTTTSLLRNVIWDLWWPQQNLSLSPSLSRFVVDSSQWNHYIYISIPRLSSRLNEQLCTIT